MIKARDGTDSEDEDEIQEPPPDPETVLKNKFIKKQGSKESLKNQNYWLKQKQKSESKLSFNDFLNK